MSILYFLVKCLMPPIITHANHTTSKDHSEGLAVTYTCHKGYKASGSITKKCINGSWIGDKELVCNGITLLL